MSTIPSVGGGFVVNDKTKGSLYALRNILLLLTLCQSMKTCFTKASTNVPYMVLVYTKLCLRSKPMILAIRPTLSNRGTPSLR